MTDKRLVLLLVALVMLAAFAVRLVPTPRNVDDSFITFRYSRNIASGQGFVYNPGVQTLGTTTPLYTLTMAGISLATGGGQNFPWYALIVNALADAANAALLFLIVRRVTGQIAPAVLMGVLWALAPQSVTFAVGGMETSVAILWMLATVWAFLNERRVWVGVFAGLGMLTRPDSALWILPIGLYQLVAVYRQQKTVPWQTWLAGVLTLAPWVAFSVWYFGSPLPNSLGAKSVAYIVPPWDALTVLVQRYATPFMEFEAFGSRGAMLGAVIYPLLNLFAFSYVWRRAPRLAAFLVYPWLYAAVFASANPLMFRWYSVPPMPAWMIGAVLGLWAVITPLQRRVRWLGPAAALTMGLLWGGMQLTGWTLTPDHGPDRPAPVMAWHLLELQYQDIGTQLREEYGVTADTRVASADIGAIGYFSGATIVDTVGLVTPELSAYYPFDEAILVTEPDRQVYAVPPPLILDAQPEYFVTMEAFVRLGLEQMPAFTDNYTLVRVIPFEFYGTGVHLYIRDDVLTAAR